MRFDRGDGCESVISSGITMLKISYLEQSLIRLSEKQ